MKKADKELGPVRVSQAHRDVPPRHAERARNTMSAVDDEVDLSSTRPREVRRIEKTRMLDEARSEDLHADEDPCCSCRSR